MMALAVKYAGEQDGKALPDQDALLLKKHADGSADLVIIIEDKTHVLRKVPHYSMRVKKVANPTRVEAERIAKTNGRAATRATQLLKDTELLPETADVREMGDYWREY